MNLGPQKSAKELAAAFEKATKIREAEAESRLAVEKGKLVHLSANEKARRGLNQEGRLDPADLEPVAELRRRRLAGAPDLGLMDLAMVEKAKKVVYDGDAGIVDNALLRRRHEAAWKQFERQRDEDAATRALIGQLDAEDKAFGEEVEIEARRQQDEAASIALALSLEEDASRGWEEDASLALALRLQEQDAPRRRIAVPSLYEQEQAAMRIKLEADEAANLAAAEEFQAEEDARAARRRP